MHIYITKIYKGEYNQSMIKRFILLICVLILQVNLFSKGKVDKNMEKKPFSSLKTYELVFCDDFDGTNLDLSKWEPCPEWERQGHMKNHGWWADECVSVKDGNLVLECKKAADGRLISGAVRTLSKDYTKQLFMQNKGMWEMKFKVDKADGLWYAFWMMANNNDKVIGKGAVDGAELDFFEILPGKSWWKKNGIEGNFAGRMMTTFHWDGYGPAHQMKGTDGISVDDFDPDFYDKWHVYKFIWCEEGYECYLDDKLLWILDGAEYGGTVNAAGYTKISAEFGDWGGPVDKDIAAGGSKFMYVDYVKIYKEKK